MTAMPPSVWPWPDWWTAHKDRMAGTLKICFQPGEEGVVGAKSMVQSGIVDDVDYFISGHIGLGDYNDGSLVCMTKGFLATDKLDAEFSGVPSHAGAEPEKGRMPSWPPPRPPFPSIPSAATAGAPPGSTWGCWKPAPAGTWCPPTADQIRDPGGNRRNQ